MDPLEKMLVPAKSSEKLVPHYSYKVFKFDFFY